MHSLRKARRFIIILTWAFVVTGGTDKSDPYESLISESTILQTKAKPKM